MQCEGFLFDLDGTLVDALAVVERAWRRWGDRVGIAYNDILAFIHGKQAVTSLRHFMPGQSDAAIADEFRWLEQQEARDLDGVVALPGALALLHHLNEASIPWAIVTSGSEPVAFARRKAAGLPLPKVFVTAECVTHGKPAPDAYLLGAELFGLCPAACAVVEDAPAGILSGLNAGCRVIAVNAPAQTPRLQEADLVISSLEQLAVDALANGHVQVMTKN